MAQPFTLELLDGPKWIIDPPVDPYGDGYVQRARVEIRADGLAAHTIANLDSTTPQTLAQFFSQLDADWRGWEGERRWRARRAACWVPRDRRSRMRVDGLSGVAGAGGR